MVAQCAGCNIFPIWAALIVGGIGGATFHLVHWLTIKARMDDPLDAVAVHFGGGCLGVITAPIFKVNSKDKEVKHPYCVIFFMTNSFLGC